LRRITHNVQGFTSGATDGGAERDLPEAATGARARVQEVAFTALVNVPEWVVQKLPDDRSNYGQYISQKGNKLKTYLIVSLSSKWKCSLLF